MPTRASIGISSEWGKKSSFLRRRLCSDVKFLRRLHLYLGCFFTPLLLFYLATGWYQTFHINRTKRPGEAETWISRLTSIHKDQLYPTDSATGYSTRLFQVLVVLMSVALFTSIALGLVLA